MSTSATAKKLAPPASPKPWEPLPYMMKCVKFLLEHAGAGLLLDPGMRKTSITLAAVKVLKKEGLLERVLVIAPLRVCHMVWPAEAHKWKDFNGLRVEVLHGSKKEEALERDADVYCINPEGLPWLMQEGRFEKLGIDTLVVDESSKFKRTQTVRFKQLKPVLTTFKRRWILTGSPNPNGYLDLFGQIYILDLGNALGRYITHYRTQYFYPTGYGGYTWMLQPGADKRIQAAIKPLTMRLAAEDYIQMPEVVPNVIRVELPEKARKVYDEMEEEMFTTLEGGATVTALSAGAASVKCRQVANGGLYHMYDPANPSVGKREFTNLHLEKVDAVRELADELNGAPLLVAYEFEHDLARLRAAFGKNVPYIGGGVTPTQCKFIEAEWNKDKIPVLLGHPAAMGHGLNFQEGSCQHIVWHSNTWDYELYDQFIRRVRRSGNKHKQVFVHHIVARDTIDEAMLRAIKAKRRTQNALLDALKTYIKVRRANH
jgi:SNF2 family DNA or RNA helicase